MSRHIAIVTPVLDDWAAFAELVAEIARCFRAGDVDFHLVAVDDGSNESFDAAAISLPPDACIVDVEIVRLALNLGHQRAIAVGLCAVLQRRDIDAVVVMDSDGEDRPEDIAALLAASEQAPGRPILARRARRSEGRMFRFFYSVYKLLFRILVGQSICFGNFALLPRPAVRRLVHMGELWNNLAAAIMRSRVPYLTVPTNRGHRYAGRSTMGLVGLVVHGLSAMAVYTDKIFVRILIVTSAVAFASLLGIVGVVAIRLTTKLAVPGWATTAAGDLLILLMQTVVILVATTLVMLAGRSNRPILPMVDAWPFVAETSHFRVHPARGSLTPAEPALQS
jgi:polyisoprenyl-phosphate glycosyltransferase